MTENKKMHPLIKLMIASITIFVLVLTGIILTPIMIGINNYFKQVSDSQKIYKIYKEIMQTNR